MAQPLIDASGLPDDPVDAAASFHARIVPLARKEAAQGNCLITFDAADHTHDAWRRAAIQDLAREMAPSRVNGITGGNALSTVRTAEYLAQAPGVTGQVFAIDAIADEKG